MSTTFYPTVINHKAKTITTYEITPSVVDSIKDLFEMFKSDEEPVYSLGFQRYQKLSLAKLKRVNRALIISGVGLDDLYNTLHLKLESMSEEEFKTFKKSK